MNEIVTDYLISLFIVGLQRGGKFPLRFCKVLRPQVIVDQWIGCLDVVGWLQLLDATVLVLLDPANPD